MSRGSWRSPTEAATTGESARCDRRTRPRTTCCAHRRSGLDNRLALRDSTRDLGEGAADDAESNNGGLLDALTQYLDCRDVPEVVIAALGSKSTFVADCTTIAASAVMPSLSDLGACKMAMVTGYSTTLLETVETGDTAVTTPFSSMFDKAARVTDAGWLHLDLDRIGFGDVGDELE